MSRSTNSSEPGDALRRSVHVWLYRLEAEPDASLALACRALLDAAERKRADRFLRESDRRAFEVSHALVRRVLTRYAGVPPQDWRFEAERWGRPEVTGPTGAPRYRFSLSHTRGLIACAITDGAQCGVDVESLARRGNPLRVAERVLSANERTELAALPAARRLERLLEYWTLKEAYLKARGTGMMVPMRSLSFAVEKDGARLVTVEKEAPDGPGAWAFFSTRATPEHRLAVALGPPDGPSRTVRVREGLPGIAES